MKTEGGVDQDESQLVGTAQGGLTRCRAMPEKPVRQVYTEFVQELIRLNLPLSATACTKVEINTF
jgi:hypothetical protein